jgi:hypothetical protein
MDLGSAFGMAMGMALAVLVVFIVGTTFYVRIKASGGVYCFLLASNKQLDGFLVRPKGYTATIGDGEDAKMFIIHPTKQFWSRWPPGFPKVLQVPVPTYIYCDGNAEPLDPYDRKALISPESLRKIADEAMLKQTWKDVKESLGIKAPPINKKMILILLIVIIIGVVVFWKFGGANMSCAGGL